MQTAAGDLSFNIVHTIYATFVHNYILLAYLIGVVISVLLALRSPSRYATLLILGFTILAFSFEYDKHIVEGLREQTLNSLITSQPHYRLQRWVNVVISEVMPVLLYIGGWGLIYIALLMKSGNKSKQGL